MAKRSADVSFPLLTYLDELVESLRELAPKAIKDHDADAVHDARVTTRRLRAAIKLMEPVLSKRHRKSFGKILRDLRRRLGDMRDLDVMLECVGELKKSSAKRTDRAIEWFESSLIRQRDDARKQASKDISPPRILARLGTWWGVRSEVEEAREATDSLLAESLHLQVDAFCEQADALSGLREVASDEAAHDPHALRIAGKSLRYTLEMAAVEGHKLPAGVLRTFKRMQESLGLWHDEVVLAERTLSTSAKAMLAHHDAPLQLEVLTLAQRSLRAAERHLDNVIKLWKTRGADVAQSIRRSFPLTQPLAEPVSESKTDPDPPGSPETSPRADVPQDATPAA